MHIKVHIYPDTFSPSPAGWEEEMNSVLERVKDLILEQTINATAFAAGKTTLLDLEDQGFIVATVEVCRE